MKRVQRGGDVSGVPGADDRDELVACFVVTVPVQLVGALAGDGGELGEGCPLKPGFIAAKAYSARGSGESCG